MQGVSATILDSIATESKNGETNFSNEARERVLRDLELKLSITVFSNKTVFPAFQIQGINSYRLINHKV